MDKAQFGRLVRALREAQLDADLRQWTQPVLANRTGLSVDVIRNIELGRRSNIEEDILRLLADAFRLTTTERKEFFVASMDIERSHMRRNQGEPPSPLQSLTNLLEILDGIRLPCYVTDTYCDIVVANAAIIALLGGNETMADHGGTKVIDHLREIPAGLNLARIVFDESFGYRQLLHSQSQWEQHAMRNMWYFRARTMTTRHTKYFRYLRRHLYTVPAFRRFWDESQYIEGDYLQGHHTTYHHIHPHFGPLSYTSAEIETTTSAGSLSTILYTARSEHTSRAFETLAKEEGTRLIRLAAWPDKPLIEGSKGGSRNDVASMVDPQSKRQT